MKNQSNDMVTIEWLLPLFDEQLTRFADSWQEDIDNANFAELQEHYRQLSGALIMANLPSLGALANQLSALASAGKDQALSRQEQLMGQFSHQLLYYELLQGARTGSYRGALLTKTIEALIDNIAKVLIEKPILTDASHQAHYDAFDSKKSVHITVPNTTSIPSLQASQYHQLLTVWRQRCHELLVANCNQPSVLVGLATVTHYLWQVIEPSLQQQLWYGAEQWLQNLAQNDTPLPVDYASLLAKLEQIIQTYHTQAMQSVDEEAIKLNNCLAPVAINSVIEDIYIQLSNLATIDAHTQALLSHIPELDEATANEGSISFLARLLITTEMIMSGLEDCQESLIQLKQLHRQLKMRGWSQYTEQVGQIIDQLTVYDSRPNIDIAGSYDLIQIEQQLKVLYHDINETVQALDDRIDVPFSKPITTADQPSIIGISQLRSAVNIIRHCFIDYIQQKDSALLPSAIDFTDLSNAFSVLRLPEIQQLTDKMAVIFEQITAHGFKELGWQLTQALADSLSALDLLLEHLALHIIDQSMLGQAHIYITNAESLLAALIVNPVIVLENERDNDNAKRLTFGVIRYDDNGEVAALLAPRQLPADSFDHDDDLRDTFIEEAGNVIGDIEDFLSIWEADTQDLTSLMEVRRSFHLLKGSGRMVGAMSISEVAWAVENLLNHILSQTLLVSGQVVNLVLHTTQQLSILVADFAAQRVPSCDPILIIMQCENLVAGRPVLEGLSASDTKLSMVAASLQDNDEMLVTDINSNEKTHIENSSTDHLDEIKIPTSNNTVSNDLLELDEADQQSYPVMAIRNDLASLSIPNTLLPLLTAAQDLPADIQDTDVDIKDIYIEEAEEVIAEITPLYARWRQSPDNLTYLPDIRRGFHTLKGSGRMVGALYTAELAWAIEEMLNRLLDHTIQVSNDIFQLLDDVLSAYPALIKTFAQITATEKVYPSILPLWVACARAYSQQLGDAISYAELSSQYAQQSDIDNRINQPSSVLPVSSLVQSKVDLTQVNHVDYMLKTFQSVNERMAEEPVAALSNDSKEDQDFCQIFFDEAQSLLKTINQFISDNNEQAHVEVSDEIVRAFHTLRAASGSKALVAISDVSAAIEQSLEQLQQQDIMMNAEHLQALTQSTALIENYLLAYEQCIIQQKQLAHYEGNIDVDIDNHLDIKNRQELTAIQAMLSKLQSMPKVGGQRS